GLLENELNSDNAAAAEQLLRALNGALAMSRTPSPCPRLQLLLARLCGASGDIMELQLRREQLRQYHAHRQREVVEQIGEAVRTIQAEMEVVVLGRQQAESWGAKVREAEDKEKKGIGSFAETTEAKGEWFQARRKVVEETANLQRARVLLHQAQG